MKKTLMILLMMGLTGCVVAPTPEGALVTVTSTKHVHGCIFLGSAYGESRIAYMAAGTEEAKYRALDDAAKMGATHLVWTDVESSWQPSASGRAYRCVMDK